MITSARQERLGLKKTTVEDASWVRFVARVKWICSALLVGAALSFYLAEGSASGYLLLPLLAVSGSLVIFCIGLRSAEERLAFLLTFSICSFCAGASELLTLTRLGSLQSTIDAQFFFELSRGGLDQSDFEGLKKLTDAPLPVFVWQCAYSLLASIGVTDHVFIGLIINCFVTATGVAIAIGTVRMVTWNRDALKMAMVSAAFCGHLWLNSAIFIRDSFAFLFSSLFLYSIAKLIGARNISARSMAAVCLVGSIAAMVFVRDDFIPFTLGFSIASTVCYALAMRSWKAALAAGALCIFGIYYLSSVGLEFGVRHAVEQRAAAYSAEAEANSRSDSLGYRYIVSAPTPVRLLLGSAYLHLFPIPLWHGFLGVSEYHLFKSLGGLFMVFAGPAMIGGVVALRGDCGRNRASYTVLVVAALYAIVGTVGVALTSLETRHHSQFFSAYFVLIAASVSFKSRILQTWATIMWFSIVLAVHALWLMLRG